MELNQYFELNRISWNSRTPIHVKSDFYDLPGFNNGRNVLPEIDKELLGNIEGLSVLHLQCHFGLDTLSMARMGARVTGIDLSDSAINQARQIASENNLAAEFICCNVYDLPDYLTRQYDLIYTSYGALIWLPDLSMWAEIIQKALKPGGRFVMAEFHPVAMMFDEGFNSIKYPYFNSGAIIETENGTYTNRDAPLSQEYVTWNHSLEEITGSLLKQGLQLETLREYDYSPYNCFENMTEAEPGKFKVSNPNLRIPMVIGITFSKPV